MEVTETAIKSGDTMSVFEWNKTKQLNWVQLLLATFLPSVFAFGGFHLVLPKLTESGMPSLLAWPLVASSMLMLFVVLALLMMKKEAGSLRITLKERLSLRSVSRKDWLITIGLVLLIVLTSGVTSKLSVLIMELTGYTVPDYMPFFLNPTINPMTSSMEQLSPGYVITGKLFLIIPMFITIILNVLTEDFYFRAWMQPKMAKYGKYSWLLSGVLFALYHTFQIWLLPTLLIATCSMAYITQRTRSIVPSITVHLLVNGLLGVAGMIAVILW